MPTALPSTVSTGRSRRWAFRAAAVALGLSLFIIAEVACRLAGWGRPADFVDPFVGFDARQPLFVRDESGRRYEIPSARRRFFRPESFSADKESGEFRVFVLGGSTVAGEPYSSETSFTTWLELALCAAEPKRRWNVVNCGGISYASYRLTPILTECLTYQPDLFVISTGHNEFLEERTYRDLKSSLATQSAAFQWLTRLRLVTLFRAGIDRVRGPVERVEDRSKPQLPSEVDALLDHEGGLGMFHRDEQQAEAIRRHFGHNLRAMVSRAEVAGVPVILVRETSNLADCPPFKSEHREGLAAQALRDWERAIASSRTTPHSDVPTKIDRLRQALAIDDRFALTWYELGKCLESQRDYDSARKAFINARDLDICPLRITSPLEEELVRAAADSGVFFVDAHQLLEQRTTSGILGDDWLVDHVHPSFAGHQAIAVALLDEMSRAGLVHPENGSAERRQAAFDLHLAALPPIYFERGRRTLELLHGWTQGRAERVPLHDP